MTDKLIEFVTDAQPVVIPSGDTTMIEVLIGKATSTYAVSSSTSVEVELSRGPQGIPGLNGEAGGATIAAVNDLDDAVRAYVRSFAATDLVANGTGYLRNNYNFSGFVFDPTDAPIGGGSFDNTAAGSAVFSDELIPVDLTRRYRLRTQMKQKGTNLTTLAYDGLCPFDLAGNVIAPQNYMSMTGTLTTLAAALKPGDTVMYLTSVAGWANAAGVATYKRTPIFWDYVDTAGKVWGVETYSRHVRMNSYEDGSVNSGSNTITLSTPFLSQNFGYPVGYTIPAGTAVSNGSSGGNYMYGGAANAQLLPNWDTVYAKDFYGSHTDKMLSATTSFPPGTAFVKLIFLLNRAPVSGSSVGSRHSVSSVSFSDSGYSQNQLLGMASSARVLALENTVTDLLARVVLLEAGSVFGPLLVTESAGVITSSSPTLTETAGVITSSASNIIDDGLGVLSVA